MATEAQILEGTASEIRRKLEELQVSPDERLRVTVSRVGKALDQGPARGLSGFRPTEFRNGVPLLPRRDVGTPVDLQLVRALLDEPN